MNVKIRSKDIPQEKKDAWEREKAGYHSLDEIARRLGEAFEPERNAEAIDYRIGKEDAQG